MSTKQDITSQFDAQVADYTASETKRNEQLRKFMSSQKDTLIIGGYGERLVVKQGCLVAMRGDQQEPVVLNPGIHGVKKIIYVMCIGDVSLAALKWIQREKIQLMVLDRFGDTMLVQGIETKNHALRARQYGMSQDDQQAYARFILKQKLMAQAETLRKHTSLKQAEFKADEISGIAQWYDLSEHLRLEAITLRIPQKQRYMQKEGEAANIYFEAWKNMSVKWQKSDQKRVREYWKSYNNRHDANHASARNAHHPVNAMLNLAYGVLAQRVQLACLANGLEIEIGFLHSNKQGRASLVCDLMEPARAMVDDLLLTYLEKNSLMLGDFAVEESGVVKLRPHFAKSFVAYISNGLQDEYIHSIVNEYCNFLLAEAVQVAA